MNLQRIWWSLAAIVQVATAFAGPSHAQDITCRNGETFRRVQVVIANPTRGLPCDVILWSTPDDRRRLWRAEFERGFCTEKLQDFVKRLTDARWRCQPTHPPPSERRPAGRQPVM
ncbi:MAG: hypothetical protein R3F54_23360 [Alphaproteobacteria bacterium]